MEKLNVQLTREHLFDFLLYHTFSKASGFLVNMLGMCLIVLGAVMQMVVQHIGLNNVRLTQ